MLGLQIRRQFFDYNQKKIKLTSYQILTTANTSKKFIWLCTCIFSKRPSYYCGEIDLSQYVKLG